MFPRLSSALLIGLTSSYCQPNTNGAIAEPPPADTSLRSAATDIIPMWLGNDRFSIGTIELVSVGTSIDHRTGNRVPATLFRVKYTADLVGKVCSYIHFTKDAEYAAYENIYLSTECTRGTGCFACFDDSMRKKLMNEVQYDGTIPSDL